MAGSELLQGQSEVFFNTPPIPPPLSTLARAERGATFCFGCPATGRLRAAEICYWPGKNACDEFRAPGKARWSKLMLRSEAGGVHVSRRWRAAASRSCRAAHGINYDRWQPLLPSGSSRNGRVVNALVETRSQMRLPSFARRGERGAGGVSGGNKSS